MQQVRFPALPLHQQSHEITSATITFLQTNFVILSIVYIVILFIGFLLLDFSPTGLTEERFVWRTFPPMSSLMLAIIYLTPGLVRFNIANNSRWSTSSYRLQSKALSRWLTMKVFAVIREDFPWTAPEGWVLTDKLRSSMLFPPITYWSMDQRFQ